MTDLRPDRERQAVATIRGFGYQCYQTIKAWLQCGPDEELRCEFAEDFDLVRRDSADQVTEAELNQVKHVKKNVTLNSDSVVQLINNFFRHKSTNPSLKLKIRLCTIADRGKESNVDWPYATCGMDLWDRLRARELVPKDQTLAIQTLRTYLQGNMHLSNDVRNFLNNSDDAIFLSDFIDTIFWDTGQPPYDKVENDIRQILAARKRPIADALEVEQVVNRLWKTIIDLLASDSNRTVTPADLEKLLSKETTITIDRAMVKEMATEIGDISHSLENLVAAVTSKGINVSEAIELRYEASMLYDQLPPLHAICSPRTRVLDNIRAKSHGTSLLWIYGSIGYGKTTIANLLVRDANTTRLWFRLRGLVNFELNSALASILRRASQHVPGTKIIIVLDDLSLGDTDTTSIELIARILGAAKVLAADALLIVTSQGFSPTRLMDLLANQLTTFDMPAMSAEEIRELLTYGGLMDQELYPFWTTFIQARTHGHPQLVGAYISFGKEAEWKISAESFVTTPQSAESVKRESRRLLAETIRSEEARELARRLSVVNISFPRDFALAIARCTPSLQEPGHAFESLLGPWMEIIDEKHYSLSPLLEGYAASEVGQPGLPRFFKMAAYAWFSQKTLNQVQFFQLVTCALLANEEFLIAHTGYVLLTTEYPKFQIMAKELSLICAFGINETNFLKDLQPTTRFLFRMGQLRIAAQISQATSYMKLDAAIFAELEPKQDEQFYRNLLFTYYLQTCTAQNSPITIHERISRAIKAIDLFQKQLIDANYASSFGVRKSLGTVLVLATSHLQSMDDLAYLVGELNQRSAETINLGLSGFDDFPDLLALLPDRTWMAETKNQEPRWEQCQTVLSEVLEFAHQHNIPWFLAGAARAKMVVFDEYLDKPESALEVANDARQKLGANHPVIDLAESTVRFRREEYSECTLLFDRADKDLPPEHVTLERIFALRRVIIAASKSRAWDKIQIYADRGLELVKSLPDKIFGEIATVAFQLEKAWASHESEDRVSAIEHFETALKLAEGFADQRQPLFHILRLRFGHTLGWLGYTTGQSSLGAADQIGKSARPFSGVFANLEEPPPAALDRPGVPYEGFWAMLAKYAAWYTSSAKIKSFAERSVTPTAEGQFYLSLWSARGALFANHLAEEDFDAALISGLDYVKIEVAGSAYRAAGKEAVLEGYVNFGNEELSPEFHNQWVEAIPFRVFEPILMTLCSAEKSPQINFNAWRQLLRKTLGTHDLIDKTLECLEIGLTRDADATKKALSMAHKSPPVIPAMQRLGQLICCASKTLAIKECIAAQASYLLAMPSPLEKTLIADAFTRMVAKRWRDFATTQKFLITLPTFYSPILLQAASQKVPTIADCANLLILVAEAAQITWPTKMAGRLRQLGQKV